MGKLINDLQFVIGEMYDMESGPTELITKLERIVSGMKQNSDNTNVLRSLPCDHSDWDRWIDEDNAIITKCTKCGEVWRQ